jgi:hypothetical protein
MESKERATKPERQMTPIVSDHLPSKRLRLTLPTTTDNTSSDHEESGIPAASSDPTANPPLVSDSESDCDCTSMGSWQDPNTDDEERMEFDRVRDRESTPPLLRTVFDLNGAECQMVLAALEDMETRVRGDPDPSVLPWTVTRPLLQFPSKPSYFWLMYWRAYVEEQMDKAKAMW